MTQEATVELTDEQKAAAAAIATSGGKVANVDAAVTEAQKSPEDKAKEAKDTLDAENAAKAKADEDQKAAEEAAKKAADEANDDSWKKEWIAVGNDHADAAIEIMKAAGVTPVEGNAIFEEAIKTGDLTKVKWEVLEARIGKHQALMVKTGVESYYGGEYKAQQEVVNFAHEQVGGEEGWAKVQAWAKGKEASDPKFKAELNEWRAALKQNGFAAKAAVSAIKAAYEAAPGNSSLGTKQIERGSATAGDSSVGDPLSRVEFFQAMEKAGGDRAPESVKASLRARRALGRQKGL